MDLTGLKVKIGLKIKDKKKTHAFPDFNQLPVVILSGMDWSYYVDMFGLGWCYDKVAGHVDHDPVNESPAGTWIGCLLVPQQFVTEAIDAFPTVCSAVIEADYQNFYDNRAMVRVPENHYDKEAMELIDRVVVDRQELVDANPSDSVSKGLLNGIKAKQAKALDPNDETPGIRKNHARYWADHKIKSSINYV